MTVAEVQPGSEVKPGSIETAAPRVRPSLASRPLIGLVRLYQIARRGRPSPCRYVPSCSAYAVEALETHGAARGLWLTARRLGRCQPWGGYGADPVPPPPPRRSRGGASAVLPTAEALPPTPTEES